MDREYLSGAMGDRGELGSPWLAAEAPQHPPLEDDIDADAIIVGAGLVGALVAAELVARGLEVVVLERGRAAGGTSGHSTAKITVLHGTDWSTVMRRRGLSEALAQWAGLNALAPSLYARIVEDRGIACRFRQLDGYLCELRGAAGDALALEWHALRALGLASEEVDVVSDSPFGPAVALRVPDQAQFDPAAFAVGLLATLPAGRSTLFERSAVRQLHGDGGEWRAVTDDGSVRAPVAVMASLAPSADPALLFSRCFPYAHYALEGMVPAEVRDGLWIQAGGSELTARPTDDPAGPWIFSGASTRLASRRDEHAIYDGLREQVLTEAAVVSTVRTWSAEDFSTPDGLPFVGRVGPHDGLYYIGGFGGWGLSKAVVAAALVADQIEGAAPGALSRLLSPNRFPLTPSWPMLLRENLHPVRHLLAPKPFQLHAAASLPGIAAGEPMPRCTHMGCHTKVNTVEGTIDCPCHGSRFGDDGYPLYGPARQDLQFAPAEVHPTA